MDLKNFFAAGIVNTVSFDFKENSKKILDLSHSALKKGKKFLATAEFSLCGSSCGDLVCATEFSSLSARRLLDFKYSLPEGITVGVGLALRATNNRVYDVYALVRKGAVLGLCAVSSFHNSRDSRVRNFSSSNGEEQFIIGTERFSSNHVIEVDGVKVGICFNPGDEPFIAGADLIVVPELARYELGAEAKREEYVNALSKVTSVPVISVNLSGCENGSDIYDGLCLYSENGTLKARSRELVFSREKLFSPEDGIAPYLNEFDTVVRAVGLGLFDWMLKTKSHGFALSLSGGADSALCAASIGYSQLAAFEELGYEKYAQLMKTVGFEVPEFSSDPENYIKTKMMPQVLHTVYQASKISGSVTRTAASKLAEDLGATYYEWSIADLVAMYTDLVNSTTPDDHLNYERDDLTLQNIQARSRAPGIWMIANRYGKLLVTTCNASEDAVGYCTMDGDTAGGVAPLGDISKSRILKINRHIADNGIVVSDKVKLHLPNMDYVAVQAPTAELRPGQTDERDLMPYVVLDRIHVLNQINLMFPQQILDELVKEFTEYSREDLKTFVIRYFRKLSVAQWKRERGATTFHIEASDLNAKNGFAFPLLNDGMSNILEGLK